LFRHILPFLFAACASAQSIHFETSPKSILEERLKLATRDNAERYRRLRKLFLDSGCETQEQPVGKKGQPNLICTLKGQTDRVILVGAHFDALSPGVADNWSGASLLPALFESLSKSPRRHTFQFVGFTDEEKGLLGSKFYVKRMTKDDKDRTAAMINIDTLGFGEARVWISRSDKTLTDWFAAAAVHAKIQVSAVILDKVGSTDSESFAPTKIPRITISSITQETLNILHTPKDDFPVIRMDDYYDSYRLLALYLALLDVKLGV
jgi:putative aminopeptidase FrvX